ncbi:MAG: FecR family protein, partial [Sphingobacteriaceae bacterium]
TEIIKSDNGQLQYLSLNSDNKQEVLYNTLSIPRGGQYKVVLPDGTQVWLNAASSLKYPTAFNGNERVVQLEGEAYFEVAKNAAQPFRVEVKDVKVTVLGTHFNINGYTDEAHIKTTLLEGSVKISKGPVQQLLHPGEQAITGKSSTIEVVKANSDEVLAWKNGYFNFHRSNLQEVMRQLSRWYDVDIKYEGKVPDREFGGEISRNSKASEVLKILELSDVHFRIEGEHIIVMP